jgi:hypothetical protein
MWVKIGDYRGKHFADFGISGPLSGVGALLGIEQILVGSRTHGARPELGRETVIGDVGCIDASSRLCCAAAAHSTANLSNISTPGDQFEGASARGRRAALAASWHRSLGMSLVYFCSEHIEDAEASRGARVWWLLAHDINSELHPLAVDVQSCDCSAFRDAIKVLRECSP